MTRRRRRGTGSVYPFHRSWAAQISMGGRKIRRLVATEELAEAAIRELIKEHRPDLGWHYREWPKPFRFGEGPERASRSMSVRLRFTILERDGFACHYCGARPPEVVLHVDHILPVAAGGTDDPANLAAACEDCNLGKADRVLR